MATNTTAKITLTAEDRASRVIGQVKDQMGRAAGAAQELSAAAGLVGPAFVALGSVAGLAAFVVNINKAVDALNDVADATGSSVESLSALERVARLNGGTLDDVSGVLVKFNAALAKAGDPQSDAAGVFKALGLSVRELQALDPSTALQKTAVALQGFAADGNKARVIQELFGKSIKEAAPFLKDLAEAGQLNATVTTAQAEQAERFNKALYAMKANSEDARRALVLNIGATLNDLIERYKVAADLFGGFGGILKAGLTEKLSFKDPAEGLREYVRQIEVLDTKLRQIDQGKASGLGATPEMIKQRRDALEEERQKLVQVREYYRTLMNAGGAGAGRGSGFAAPLPSLPASTKPGKPAGETKDEIDDRARALASYVDQLDRELTKVQDLSTEQEALNKLRAFGAIGENAQVREMVLGLSREIDLRKQGAEFAKAMAAEMARQTEEVAGLDRALMQFSGRTADALKQAQTARLEARLAQGEVFTPEELDRIVKGIGGIEIQAKDTTDTMQKMLDQFARNAQDALGDTLEATLRGNFDSIGQLWGNLLLKMAAQAAAAQIGQTLFGDFANGGGIGGVFGSLLGSFGFGPGKANGGSVGAMSLQRVNERGFEVFTSGGQDWLMTGGRGGVVTPASQVNLAAPQAAPIVNVTNNVQAGVTRGEVTTAVQWGMQQALQTMRAELRAQRVLA